MADLLNRARMDGNYDDLTPMWLETELTIQLVDITIAKTADREVWGGDDPLTYTVTITNNDTSTVNNVVLTDTLDITLVEFEEGSVEVNGVPTTDYTYNAATGVLTVNLQDLAAGASLDVTFRVTKA